ncbi:hypothetical protein AWR36_010180 [Microbulbifer flavimaris]|uniref:Lipoprotein n=1 Tax=Microbulbifer flavimaris TaxID=1781068 RepID=A0ABX4HY78_9GAMM|nr:MULTISPECIES: hypothetical protein [Microbulbifer]KUJ82908.1 hypothetical protein AVO43_10150 [Microbulbifer sp. ZGT114]PCO05090.1 hypothetical protein AWR36_010180 [Microbulbifer flavimaris]
MNRIFLAIFLIFISGCASQEVRDIELPEIMTIEGKNFISAAAFKEHELSITRPESGELMVTIPEKEAPVYWTCGGVYWDGLVQGQSILEEADLVLDFKGIKEVWVPIEGKPKKLYIFEVR